MLSNAISSTSKDDGWASLGEVGSYLSKSHAAFDSRVYGHSKLSDLVRAQSFVDVKDEEGPTGLDPAVGAAQAEDVQGRSLTRVSFRPWPLSHGAERPGEEHERLADRREARLVHPADDDPVVAGRMLRDELAFEAGEGVAEERDAVAAQRPLDAGEAVRARRGSPAWRRPRGSVPGRSRRSAGPGASGTT